MARDYPVLLSFCLYVIQLSIYPTGVTQPVFYPACMLSGVCLFRSLWDPASVWFGLYVIRPLCDSASMWSGLYVIRAFWYPALRCIKTSRQLALSFLLCACVIKTFTMHLDFFQAKAVTSRSMNMQKIYEIISNIRLEINLW